MSTQFNCQKNFFFNLLTLIQRIQFSISIVFVYEQLNVKIVLFQTIQFSINLQFKYQISSIPNNSI